MFRCWLIVLISVCSCLASYAQHYSANIKSLNVDHGLLDNSIYSIYQDRTGFIWIGSLTGISRYDGYDFMHIELDQEPRDAGDTPVIGLQQDSTGHLWVATRGAGLYILDMATYELALYQSVDKVNDPGKRITYMFQSSDQRIWVLSDNGLFRVEKTHEQTPVLQKVWLLEEGGMAVKNVVEVIENNQGQLVVSTREGHIYQSASPVNNRFSPQLILTRVPQARGTHALHVDSKDKLWSTVNGQGVFVNDKDKNTESFWFDSDKKNTISGNGIVDIVTDPNGNTWIATNNWGINKYVKDTLGNAYFVNHNSSAITPGYQATSEAFHRIADFFIRTLYFDRSGTMWIGTQRNGVLIVDFKKEMFRLYRQDLRLDNTLWHRDVSIPYASKNGDLWIGTWGGGLHYITKKELWKTDPDYVHFYPKEGDSTSISFNRVFPITEDRDGNMWIGTNGGGLNLLKASERHKDNPAFIRFQHDPDKPGSISNNTITGLYIDSQNQLWVCTHSGLNLYNSSDNTFNTYLEGAQVFDLVKDNVGLLWIATNDGIFSLNPATREKKHYKYFMLNNVREEVAVVRHPVIDKQGKLWFVGNKGLFWVNRQNDTIEHYQSGEFTFNSLESVEIDSKNRLWLGSWTSGLFMLDQTNDKFYNFPMSQGNVGNSFTAGSSQAQDGTLYFGSRNGFYAFHPDSIVIEKELPEVYITALRAGENELNQQTLRQLNNASGHLLEFDYIDKVITISFSALTYTGQEQLKYAYTMQGVDKKWHTTNVGEPRVTYSNLQPGRYEFNIRVVDEFQSGQPSSFFITVKPPWWQTWWSYTGFSLLIFTLVVLLVRYRYKRQQLAQNRFKEKVEREKEEKLQQMKLEFFTNVSHEIKTPLTLIKAPLENMIKSSELSEQNTAYAELIQSNAERLTHLTNQLLDYRKVSLGQMPVKDVEIDFVAVVQNVCVLFSEWAVKNKIELSCVTSHASMVGIADKEKLESIVFNLLSNAFKHTPEGGQITVNIDAVTGENASLKITVQDTGAGIAQHKIDEIFNLFFSEGNQSHTAQRGTGIGLALVKELATLMHGQVGVESKENEGSSFYVTLEQEKLDVISGSKVTRFHTNTPVANQKTTLRESGGNGKAPLLLIAEDDKDMNHYIAMQFVGQYRVVQAYDGEQAWETARHQLPDLVITDLMMPKMDGIGLCELLKTTLETSHVPVVMLTAKDQDQDKMKGIETGADAYLTKPFSADILKATIDNLLENRKLIQEKFSKSVKVEPSGVTITSVDEKFIQQALEVVDKHLSDSSFSVEELAKDVGVSTPQLYRKIKGITGMAPNEFIRNLRLKRAVALLEKSGLTISEISYEVGFSNPKYFSRCFSQQFGNSPKTYREQNTAAK